MVKRRTSFFEKDWEPIIKDIIRKYPKNEMLKMIKELRYLTGMDIKEAKDVIDYYLNVIELEKRNKLAESEKSRPRMAYVASSSGAIQKSGHCFHENNGYFYYPEPENISKRTQMRQDVFNNPLYPLTWQIEIDEGIKKQAVELLEDWGLNLSEAINMFLKQIVLYEGIPFDIKYPKFKPEVIEAMQEAKRISRDPNIKGYTNVKQMFKEILEDETDC